MNWLKEWDKCVFRRVVPGKKRRIDDRENIPVSKPPLTATIKSLMRTRLTRWEDPENV